MQLGNQMINRRQALQGFAAVAAYAAFKRRALAQTVDPTTLPLVTSNTPLFTYLGTFRGPADGAFQYGAGAMSVSGSTSSALGNLYANGLQQGTPNLGLMTIPDPTGANGKYSGSEVASTLIAPKQIPGIGSGSVTTGSLVYGSQLYVTEGLVYDATGAQNTFLVPMKPDFTSQGAPCSANGNAGSINRMFSNYMGIVPAIWQPYLGGPAFIAGGPGGEGGLSIISQLCCGYGFSTFDPTKVIPGQPIAIREWINWPYDTQSSGNPEHVSALWPAGTFTQSNWTSSNPGNNYISCYDRPIGCAFIPDGSRSLLFVHWHSYGPSGGPHSSPCNTNASGSNETPVAPDTSPYIRMQVVAFDLAEVIKSRNGGGAVTAVLPYAWWEFPNWQSIIGSASSCPIDASWPGNAWAAFDPVARPDGTHRMYWNGNFGGTNGTVYVFSVAGLDSSTLPNAPGNVSVS